MGRLDGNALAGPLSQALGADISDAAVRCTSCQATRALGAGLLHLSEMGAVLRCPVCDNVLLVLSYAGASLVLAAPGIATLHLRSVRSEQ